MFFVENFLKILKPRFDDDLIDQLNYYYTPWLMSVFALLIAGKQYFGEPLQCWVPAEFTGAWEQYAEYYCFVQNTYFVLMNEQIPDDYRDRKNKEIGYYQWVPFVLALQAFLFFLPIWLWRMFNWWSGIRTKAITNMAVDVGNMETDKRNKNVKLVAGHLQASLDLQRELKPTGRLLGTLFYGKHYGIYVTGLYLVIKVLFILNVVGQFFILNRFLGPQYKFWGLEILRDIAYGRPWEESGHFPRVTMCDFDIRTLANTQRKSIQCVLLLNMFNEKIYLFLWWWFLIVSIATCLNFVYWVLVSIIPSLQRAFIHRFLLANEKYSDDPVDQRQLRRFVHRNLRPDGVLLIRLIATNGGELIATQLVHKLWKKFVKHDRPSPEDSREQQKSPLWKKFLKRNRLPPSPFATGPKSTKDMDSPARFVENLHFPEDEKNPELLEKGSLGP